MSGSPTPAHPLDYPAEHVPMPPGSAVPESWARRSRGVLVGAWLLVTLVHLCLGRETRLQAWPLGYLFLEALATASLAYRAWRTPGAGRLAWWLLALSALLEVPNLALTLFQLHGSLSPWMSGLPNLLSLTTGILVVAGILSFPKGRDRGGMFRRRALDSLIFATSLLFLLWVMGVQASLRSAAPGVGLRVFVAYLNVTLLGGGLVFMTSYHPDRTRGPLGWFAASGLAWLAGLSCWTLAGLPVVVAYERWIVVVGCIPLFQGLSAVSPRSGEKAPVRANPGRGLTELLPYLPVTLAIGLLAALLAWAPRNVTRGAVALFLAMVVLILLRQFQAIQDLLAARRTLKEQVQQRTEALRQAQETLLRTERMNTLALLGAGLAHDLNNLLCAMKSSVELAAMNLEDGQQPTPADLTRIVVSADRAASLTARLMGFVRREDEALSPTHVGRELKDMEANLRLLLPRSVNFQLELSAEEPLTVWSSSLRLEQMLVNLVANAGDAMPDGGSLRLHAGLGGPERGSVLIEVADTGHGMSPEILARIFDPFFTTKPPGKGTGLGLCSLKALVEEGGGSLEADSKPGKGSRFRIYLPALSPR